MPILFDEEIEKKVDEEIRELVQAGVLEEKLCFAYCGEQYCNCVGGNRFKIWSGILRKINKYPTQ